MIYATVARNEEERLKELLDYKILDTDSESSYDELCHLASLICQTPMAVVSLIDRHRQWFKAKKGLDAQELDRDTSFCGHAIHEKEILIVNDPTKDFRFHDNPYVVSGDVRFYAGVPLITRRGFALGTLCVADREPRELATEQILALKILARQVTRNLELHRALVEISDKYGEVKYLSRIVTQQKSELIETAKFAAVGTLAAGMAHEINNPIAVIDGKYRQLVRMVEKGSGKEEILQAARPIETMIKRIASITRGMLDYSRDCGKDQFCGMSVKEVIDKSLDLCRGRLNSYGIQIELPGFEDLTIEGRAIQISQILVNLLHNACDAIQTAQEKWIRIEVLAHADRVAIVITDSGRGIPKDIADRIMEPFFTTKAIGAGTGLGLSLSKGIAEAHHGSLALDAAAVHTRFVLELPKEQPKTADAVVH